MCPVEKGSLVILDRASRGGQEGDLSAGTRDWSGRQRCETQIWSKKMVQAALGTREAVVGERSQQSLFLGMIVPVCLLGTQKENPRVQLYHCSPMAEAGGARMGHEAGAGMTLLCAEDFQ